MGIYELGLPASGRAGHVAGTGGKRNWCPSPRRGLMTPFLGGDDDISPIEVGGGPKPGDTGAMGEGLQACLIREALSLARCGSWRAERAVGVPDGGAVGRGGTLSSVSFTCFSQLLSPADPNSPIVCLLHFLVEGPWASYLSVPPCPHLNNGGSNRACLTG